jgi:hypothetical protein
VAGCRSSRVFALYKDFPSLRSGVDNLKSLRFDNHDITVLFPEAAVSKAFGEEEDAEGVPENDSAFIGGSLGWLTYVRPERTGVIADALVALGVGPRQAGQYENHLRNGSLLVCIRSSSTDQFDSAAAALLATGAESVLAARPSERSECGRIGSYNIPPSRILENVFTAREGRASSERFALVSTEKAPVQGTSSH